MDEKKPKSQAELDDFWDIDQLIPKKPVARSKAHTSFDTSTVEVTSAAREIKSSPIRSESLSDTEFRRFVPPFTEKDFAKEQKQFDDFHVVEEKFLKDEAPKRKPQSITKMISKIREVCLIHR